jgi:hypothetical protein
MDFPEFPALATLRAFTGTRDFVRLWPKALPDITVSA